MSGFMKTVSKTACTKIAGMFLENRSDIFWRVEEWCFIDRIKTNRALCIVVRKRQNSILRIKLNFKELEMVRVRH